MPYYNETSQRRLDTCCEEIQTIWGELIETYDVTVRCGVRLEEAQNRAFASGASEKQWDDSKHNPKFPSNRS